MKKIEIFDIDGCICECFFPNLGENADIAVLKKRIIKTPLEAEFIRYFRKISNSPGVESFFITGRRSKDFQDETFFQLAPLQIDKDRVIFFPDNYSHTKIRYNNFKIFHILSFAAKHKDSEIIVYDDLDGYFSKLLSTALKLKIEKLKIEHVKNPKRFWKVKLKEV